MLLVISLLGLIAYLGLGGDDNSEQTKAPSTGALTATATPVTAAKTSEAVTPSPTQAATAGGLFLQLAEPSQVEVFTDTVSMTVAGRIRVDAMVTINDTLVEPQHRRRVLIGHGLGRGSKYHRVGDKRGRRRTDEPRFDRHLRALLMLKPPVTTLQTDSPRTSVALSQIDGPFR